MRKILSLLAVASLFFIEGFAQSCVPTGINGSAFNLYCGQTCTNLSFQVPHLKSSENYALTTIPYNPLPYTTAAGTVQSEIYIDDKFSHQLTIPFNFCFYGSSYNSFVIGSNGVISFDATQVDCNNAWQLKNGTAPVPVPFVGTLPCSNGTGPKYPRLSIMAPYHDIDPSKNTSTRKIEWRVEGSAPCRKVVVSFYKIALFGDNAQNNTSQIIIYESTGLIDINIEEKTLDQAGSVWNENFAILGIQKDEFTALTAPGKNCTVWTANNEAYRFTPTGATSRFLKSELLTLSGTFIANADTGTTTAGLLDLKFNNFCPAGPGQFVIKTIFADCSAAGNQLISLDTITINQQATLPLTATVTSTACGASTGTITATVPAGAGTAPYKYSLDGGPLQSSNIFTGLPTGNHSLHVVDDLGCPNTITVFVPSNTTIGANSNAVATSCPGVNNGTVTITPTGGTAPYNFSLNGGPAQTSGTFTGLAPGNYTVTFTDAGGCSGSATATVTAGAGLTATKSEINTSCSTVNDGSATVTPTNGTAPFSFSLNGGPAQGSGTFTNLAPGLYPVVYTDANNCSGNISVRILAGPTLTSNTSFTNPPCAGINNGTVTVTPTTGTGPYTFSLNGGPTQPSGVFSGLAAGSYNISFTDSRGCIGTATATLTSSTAISTTVAFTDANCFGENNGSITVNPAGGNSPYQFSIDTGATYQSSGSFNNLIAKQYTIRIRDANGCTKDTVVSISQPTLLTASATPTAATCNNNDGVIVVTAAGGSPSYEFSIDNGASYQASNSFTVAPAAFNNIKIKDSHGCIAGTAATVVLNDTMRLSFGPELTSCQGTPATLVPLTNSQTSVFTWTPATGLSSTSVQNPAASPNDTTVYTLVAKWGVCQRTDSIKLNILTRPVAHAGNDTAICFQTFALLRGSATRTSGAVSYLWTPSGKALPSNTAFSVARPDSTQLYTLEVSDNYGCNFKVYDDVLITMQPPVPAYAGKDTNAVVGKPHQLFSSGGVSYVWTPAGPLDNPFSQFPKAILANDTRFTVTVTDVAGCVGTDDVLIKAYIGPTYYLPNAFSPNGDGLNDVFRPTPVGIVRTEYFRVFNRYGQLLFETTKWLEGWNGTFKGKKQDQGTYVWMIKGLDHNGLTIQMKGTVMLVR